MTFSHGRNDAQKPMGVLALALASYFGWQAVGVPVWVVVSMGVVAALGVASGGWRIIRTLGLRVTGLDNVQGFAAEASAASVLQFASALGIPVTTTHIITAAIVGAGTAHGQKRVRWRLVAEIGVSWMLTLPVTVLFGFVLTQLLHGVVQVLGGLGGSRPALGVSLRIRRWHTVRRATHMLRSLRVLLVVGVIVLAAAAEAEPCSPIPFYESGRITGLVCGEDPLGTVLDLDDDWVPGILSETAEQPQPYRATFVALANERFESGPAWDRAQHDRHFELFGIFPSFSVLRRRLFDAERHACHAAIEDAPLSGWQGGLASWDPKPRPSLRGARRAAIGVLQQHLVCERLLSDAATEGIFDARTSEALALYQRLHMLPSLPVVDAETREALLTPSRELDFRSLLRALRERVVDATGLIEDGSAGNAWEPILGRQIESPEYRRQLRKQPLERAAPDLIARATQAAATALGWTSPEAAADVLSGDLPRRVAVRLPPLPSYPSATLGLRVELDRGDVWTSYPLDAEGRPLPSPVRRRPTLTLIAETADGQTPLVRWPTAIGGWKREKVTGGAEVLRYKPSPAGQYLWRDLVVAPVWLPPETTPDRELLRRLPNGGWAPDTDAMGPGYASAYGIVALLHDRAVPARDGSTTLLETQIRTHGSGNYRSVLYGSSHGCHRLFNHLSIRLGSFLLTHREFVRHGLTQVRYARMLHWQGRAFELHASTRGYRYELLVPVPVTVLPGRNVQSRARHPVPVIPAPAVAAPLAYLSGPASRSEDTCD